MRVERPSLPPWPAWIGLACFVLMGLIVWQGRPQPEQAPNMTENVECPPGFVLDWPAPDVWRCSSHALTAEQAASNAVGTVGPGVTTPFRDVQGTDLSCLPFLELDMGLYFKCAWLAAGGHLDAPADPGVELSKASEDRIVRRLQQWLDRNEANRPLPVFSIRDVEVGR